MNLSLSFLLLNIIESLNQGRPLLRDTVMNNFSINPFPLLKANQPEITNNSSSPLDEPSLSLFPLEEESNSSSLFPLAACPPSQKEYQTHDMALVLDSTSNSLIPLAVTQTIPSPPPTSSKPTSRQSRNRMKISLCAPIIAHHRRRVVIRLCRLGGSIAGLEIERFGIVII